MDLRFASGVEDQQRADASLLTPGQRPGEEEKAVGGEPVHERCVVADRRLPADSVPGPPARTCLADDGEVAHARAITKWNSFSSR